VQWQPISFSLSPLSSLFTRFRLATNVLALALTTTAVLAHARQLHICNQRLSFPSETTDLGDGSTIKRGNQVGYSLRNPERALDETMSTHFTVGIAMQIMTLACLTRLSKNVVATFPLLFVMMSTFFSPATHAAQPLATCGSSAAEFAPWEVAGCYCEINGPTATTGCVSGFFSSDDTSVVTARPEAVWTLGSNSVTNLTVVDSSGNGHHGTVMGAPATKWLADSQAVINGSTIFVNGDGYIDFGDVAAFNFDVQDFVIEMSLRVNSSTDAFQFQVISKLGSLLCGVQYFWQLVIVNYQLIFNMNDLLGTDYAAVHSNFVINDSQWHVVTASRLGATVNIYIDNMTVTSALAASGACLLNNTGNVLIGARACGSVVDGYYFAGEIVNVSIRIGAPAQQLCSSRPTGFDASSMLQSLGCTRVLGFCAPAKQGMQCCGAVGCAQCRSYRSCSANFSTTSAVTATMSTMSSSSTGIALSTTSLPIVSLPSAPSPISLHVFGTDTIVIVVLAVVVLILLVICLLASMLQSPIRYICRDWYADVSFYSLTSFFLPLAIATDVSPSQSVPNDTVTAREQPGWLVFTIVGR
jgi:hypothetical protein